jgi:arylsulfatase A-like enzyme
MPIAARTVCRLLLSLAVAATAMGSPLTAPAVSASAAAPGAPPVNVVLIFVDDMGYADLGAYGAPDGSTPSLDRLALEGVRLTDFYASQPVCSASRAALLTGTYSNRIGIHGALGPGSEHGLNAAETTLAEIFRARGYATAIYGKWHLGHHPEFLPTRHGFDEFYGIPYSNDMWPYHPESPEAWGDLPTLENETTVGYNTDQRRFTRDFTERAVGFIERSAAEAAPFFVYLAHPMPHVPLFVSEQGAGASGAGLYGDVIRELDGSVGRIIETLQRLDLDRRTLVLFSSDNGPWLSYGNHAGSAGSLREGKGTTFEGGVRVPFLAWWPGTLPAGRVVSAPAMTIDLLPTLAELIGAEPPDRRIDGRSIWPLLTGAASESPQSAYAFYYRTNELQAIRAGRWKLHFPHTYRTMTGQAPGADGIPGRYDYGATIGRALFDLEADPGETTDVAALHPEIVAELERLAEGFRADLGDTLTGRAGSGTRSPGSR